MHGVVAADFIVDETFVFRAVSVFVALEEVKLSLLTYKLLPSTSRSGVIFDFAGIGRSYPA